MENWLARTRLLLGEEAVETLRHSRVAVLGLGGVGGAAAEAICRSGVGAMLLADYDKVDITNLNRQLIAVSSTVGQDKTEAAARRLRDINPELDLTLRDGRLTPENLPEVLDWQPDYILDCIDNVTAKLALTVLCREQGVKLITCLGTGNRLDPSLLRVGNLPDTAQGTGCPLSRMHAQGAAPPGHHRPHRGLLAGGAGGARRCSRRGQRTPPTGQHGLCTSGRRLPDGLPCGAGSAGPASPRRTLNCYTDSKLPVTPLREDR